MSQRTKRKIHNFKLYIIKNVLNSRYMVRNLMVATIFMAVVVAVMSVVVFKGKSTGEPQEIIAAKENPVIYVSEMSNLNATSIPVLMSGLDADSETVVQPNEPEMVTDVSDEFDDKLVAIANDVNVRAEATTDSDIVGKLNFGNVGTIISIEGDWIHFTSGEVTGYVRADFVVTGSDAKAYVGSEQTVATPVEVEEEEEDTSNQKPEQEPEYQEPVVQEPVEEEPEVEEPTTEAPEIEEPTTEEPEVEEPTEEDTSDNYITVQPTNRGPLVLTQEEINLMACIVTLESGSEPYEGQLAVANVILNRLEKGYWGDTVTEVIYAPYQFSTVNSPYLDYYLENGAYSISIQAVNDALSGNNNIGDFLYFRAMYIVDDPNSYGTHTIIGNHLFY